MKIIYDLKYLGNSTLDFQLRLWFSEIDFWIWKSCM